MDIQFLIELGLLLGSVCFVSSKFLQYRGKSVQARARVEGKPPRFQGVTALVANIDQAIQAQHSLREKMIKAGADEKALKPLDQQLRMMEMVQANQSWLQFFAPMADDVLGYVPKLVKSLAGAVS